MTMPAVKNENALTLADYEARIHLYKEQIGTGYIGIGRTLIQAKEARVVPHGEWETWVTTTTGLTMRQAQRCMEAAREIKDGTAMAQLEISKAIMLLQSGLDEDTRETVAQKAVEDSTTVRALKEQIEAIKAKAAEDAAAAETRRQAVERDARKALDDLTRQLEAARKEKEKLFDQYTAAAESAQRTSRGAQQDTEALAAKDAECKKLEKLVGDLKADLEAAEAREERRADELEELRKKTQQKAMEDARGMTASSLSTFDLTAAVRTFIGTAGVLPHMGTALHGKKAAELDAIRAAVDEVAAWVDGARRALGTMAADAVIV